jgi:antagonist of KipI
MRILKTGISTIQDQGRFGHRNQGIPTSGCMDSLASRIGNLLVGNEDSAACLEISNGAFSASFGRTSLVALTGKGYEGFVSGRPVAFWQPFLVKEGEFLQLFPREVGFTYLSVHGGIRTKLQFDSRATHLPSKIGGLNGKALQPGDHLPVSHFPEEDGQHIINYLSKLSGQVRLSPAITPNYAQQEIRFFPGPEYDWFTENSGLLLERTGFLLGVASNRMGFRLQGPQLERERSGELLSQPVLPGTMQVSPDGQILLLMADAQTTGGYPRIGQVAAVDLHLAAQKAPGSTIHFKKISLSDAETLLFEREKQLLQLKRDYYLYFS